MFIIIYYSKFFSNVLFEIYCSVKICVEFKLNFIFINFTMKKYVLF